MSTTSNNCSEFKEALVLAQLGLLHDADQESFFIHLLNCEECQADFDDIALVSDAVKLLRPKNSDIFRFQNDHILSSADLLEDGLKQNKSNHGKRRRLISAFAIAALVLIGGIIPFSYFLPGTPKANVIGLNAVSGVSASMSLIDKNWGTEVQFIESGEPRKLINTVWMEDKSGNQWVIGSYTSNGDSVVAQFGCAIKFSEFKSLWVVDQFGKKIIWTHANDWQ